MDKSLAIFFAIVCGVFAGLQPPINAGLGKIVNSKNATLVSISVSFIIILTIVLFTGNIKEVSKATSISPIYWIGGVLGVSMVFISVKIIPILGATVTYSFIVSIQLIVGAIINQFGLFGVTKTPITISQVAGMVLLFLGMKLIL
ncbi:DMT family transporter [Clostridium grantii]|uniref:Transporter family-2 protein n=1 Tax=Clostridium grantii DSM 8605 TaxID=1121316 RepID=A0A1M5VVH7_9CLOT|nr:DMT family transporter [Clostridium grantii]SHH78994.1 transporter family-2 protein [Clostridium grantii DSM 8605]